VIGADAVDRVDEMSVDLILDERGRRGGAAVADLVGLEEAGADSLARKSMGDERAGDPAADDREIAAEVVVETRVDGGEAVGNGPEGSAAGKVTGEEADGI
jgi:hypothetical protein